MPRLKLEPFVVEPKGMHDLIIMPQFGDFMDGDVLIPSDEEGDWMVMDNVVNTRPILEIFGNQNILKRRDATCKLIFSPVARLGARYIQTEKLYAATEDCQNEFYQGCFQDFRHQDYEAIWNNLMPILDKAIATDIYTNKYFGDLTRPADVNGVWSWNKFDGIFTQIAKYIVSGVIPSGQTFAIAGGVLTPADANTALQNAYDAQDGILADWDDSDKAFYVDKKLAQSYYDYLLQTGESVVKDLMSGMPKLFFRGIEVKPKKWDAVLKSLNGGTQAHAIILTIRGNLLFATDSKYGGGPNEDEAVRVWWSDDDGVWRKVIHLKGGTELAAPQHLVMGITSF